MALDPNRPSSDIDHQLRAIELKNEALDIAGGQMLVTESEDADPAVAEQFWENVVAFETAPRTTLVDQLEAIGIRLPAADALGDGPLSSKLWEILGALARLGVCVENTDHLSDRELYGLLCSDLLREEVTLMPGRTDWTFHISPIGSGSDEDMQVYHRYYASEEDRQQWLREFPDDIMPAKEAPPYERDRRLRKAFEER